MSRTPTHVKCPRGIGILVRRLSVIVAVDYSWIDIPFSGPAERYFEHRVGQSIDVNTIGRITQVVRHSRRARFRTEHHSRYDVPYVRESANLPAVPKHRQRFA